jgi:uncharacterized membrane protein (GlpM family)
MKPETLFQICNSIAPLGWLLLIALPRWKGTRQIVLSGILPLLFGLVYLTLIVLFFGESEGGFDSLASVSQLFKNPYALVAGWVHYLAFDLFIGSWELKNSQNLGISHWLVVPCLILTFLFGPIGLLLYFIVRLIHTKNLLHENF